MSDIDRVSEIAKNSEIVNIDIIKTINNSTEVVDKGERTLENKSGKKSGKKTKSVLPNVKTEEERREASREILKQLETLDLSIKHKPIRELLKLLKKYNEKGDRIMVNIPFPEINRRIKGILSTGAREETYVVLKHEKF